MKPVLLLPLLWLALAPLDAPAADWRTNVNALLATAPAGLRGTAGIHVVRIPSGRVLLSTRADQLFLPASNLKLFTAALALTRLGADYRMETRLLRTASGDLALEGAGDPSFSGRPYPYDINAPSHATLDAVDALVEQAIASGLKRVDGDILASDVRYPWQPYPESWTADDIEHDYGAPVSALAINDNYVSIRIRPSSIGQRAHIELDPPFPFLSIHNLVTTADTAGRPRLRRIPGTRQVFVEGTIRESAGTWTDWASVDDPALFAAHALYDSLLRHGIPVRGRPQARHSGDAIFGDVIAKRTSPPLRQLLQTAMKVSQNLHMEMFLREVGYVKQGQGTFAAGLREMRSALAEWKIPSDAFVAEDASGLGRNDEVTPQALTRLLTVMASGPDRDLWKTLLPVGGKDGTLNNRLCCATEEVAIVAKTGSLARAITLSGYADSPRNGRLAFSILVNNFSATSAEARAWVDKIAAALLQ
jgi:serine-type D-Ala-D-Ala carboxypeptidase/endopeptidase (penicillin-binding protein 4)